LTGIVGQLVITKGLWDEPVIEGDFGLQTNETEVLGQINQADLVLNQYNWIDLNSAGIAWVNQRVGEVNQYESYDWQKTAYFQIYGNNRWSQNFTPLTSHTISSLKLRLKRVGTPGRVVCNIYRTAPSGCPTGTLLTQKQEGSDLVSTGPWGDWFDFRFDYPLNLIKDTKYAIEVWVLGSNSSNRIEWIGNTASQYPNGHACYSTNSGSTWTPHPTYALYFIEYTERIVGGTKFCLRTSFDNSDSPPAPGQDQEIQFVSAQGEVDKQPLLELILD